MGRVQDKVVLITGGARGQGRSHAVKLAEEGADIILLDICHDIESNKYALSTPRDLEEAGLEVEKTGRRVVTAEVDVRDRAALDSAIASAVAELGKLDVVVANAAICPMGPGGTLTAFTDAFDVDFLGLVNTIHASLPHLADKPSIIATGSVAGLIGAAQDNAAAENPSGIGGAGYNLAKSMIGQYVKALAVQLAPSSGRINVVHPSSVNTDMLHNEGMYRVFRPDLEHPTREEAEATFPFLHSMPIPYIEASDVTNVVCFLASDESRYITNGEFKIDAGAMLKFS